jgi:hypothetical protein
MVSMKVCCGYYCSFTALVGIYFFVVLGIMYSRENPFLMANSEYKPETATGPDKAAACFILAGINVVWVFVCFLAAKSASKHEDDENDGNLRSSQYREPSFIED